MEPPIGDEGRPGESLDELIAGPLDTDLSAGLPVFDVSPDGGPVLPAAVEAGDAATTALPVAGAAVRSAADEGDRSLLALIDRLSNMLDRTGLAEIEVEAGATTLVLRSQAAVAPPPPAPAAAVPAPSSSAPAEVTATGSTPYERPAVSAPLTGIWYSSPTPGSAPYVRVGGEVAVGQVIGLIEAMKLFNEIKSDLSGRVVRVVAEDGTLVKAKQPLIEVEPL
jgi:acetyl-CoA carboxylase biotin carboxyl carrier protein